VILDLQQAMSSTLPLWLQHRRCAEQLAAGTQVLHRIQKTQRALLMTFCHH
jgi:hypothetical protein